MAYNTKVSPIINLAAKMNTRSNNEVLDIDPNQTSIELTHLSNGDLFFTKALTSRQGVKDIGGGILNATTTSLSFYDFQTPSGTAQSDAIYLQSEYYDRAGTLIVAPSGDIFTGKVYIQGAEAALTNPDLGRDLQLNMWISKVNAAPYPSSGIGAVRSNLSPNPIDKISLTGFHYDYTNVLALNYAVPFAPGNFANDSKPEAVSIPTIFNLGPYSGVPGNYATAIKEVDWQFYAPYPVDSSSVYFLKVILNFASGVQTGPLLNLGTQYKSNTATDLQANMVQAEERAGSNPGIFANYYEGGGAQSPKVYLKGTSEQYSEPNYAIVDYPDSSFIWSIPAANGYYPSPQYQSNLVWQPTPNNTNFTWPGLIQAPASGTTNVVEFGNLMTVPSGQHIIQGGYCYMGIISGNGWNPFTVNKATYPALGYNVGYEIELSEVTSGIALFAGSKIKGKTLASYKGNHVFNNPYTFVVNPNSPTAFDPATGSTQTQLDKIYAIFDNPVTINNISGTQYLLSFKLLDFNTGQQNTDYITKTQSIAGFITQYYNTFTSPIIIGMNNPPAVTNDYFLYNQTNDGSTFYGWNPNAVLYNDYQLSCGLISVLSGNAITSIYDYRIGDERTQEIIFTQTDKVQAFKDSDPKNTIITLWSGAATGDNYKWSHSTFQSTLFSHQYSKSSGVCWDQIYYNPSGQSMQYHGLRPEVVAHSVGGIKLPAGFTSVAGNNISNKPFDIVLATSMNTGGFRASHVIHYSGVSGINTSGVQLQGPFNGSVFQSIQNTGINTNGNWQYNFDVNSLGTYVFTTQPSGSVYFLAKLINNNGNAIPNPMPNVDTWGLNLGGSGTFLYDNSYVGVDAVQVPNIINYDQTYLINQVDMPKFKKTIVYKNTLYGIGDVNNPSRLWYSEIQAPQIFGVDTNFYGFYDIDNDNGQELTAIEIFKDYLLIFKENSMYRASFTANPGNPLEIYQVSNVKGCLGIFTTVSTDYGVIGLNQYGPFLASYAGIENIGDEILPTFQSFDRTELIFAVAIHDPARQQIYWSISSANESPDNQKGLVYSYAEKAWGLRQDSMWNAGNRIGDTDNFSKYYIGDTLGQIKQINVGDTDQDVLFVDTNDTSLTKNITLEFQTPWLNFGNSQNLKQLKFLKINCDSSNQKLRIDVYTDQNDNTKRYSRYLNMNVPVINRVCSLAGLCRTVKFVITSVGSPSRVKINSLQLGYIDQGLSSNIS